jgi:K+-transporting ATPase A subunit
MGILFIAGVVVCYWAEANGTTLLHSLGLTGGNMEGKEVRFGIVASALFAVSRPRLHAVRSMRCTICSRRSVV